MAFTHQYTLICDDFRREDNGKFMLIGIYMDAIVVPQLPFTLPQLTFFSFLDSDRPGHWALDFRLEHLETGAQIVEGHGGADVKTPGHVVAPLKFSPVQFSHPGAYTFTLSIQDHKDPIITQFSVQLNLPNVMRTVGRP